MTDHRQQHRVVLPLGLGGLSPTAHRAGGWDGEADTSPENSSSEAAQTQPEAPKAWSQLPLQLRPSWGSRCLPEESACRTVNNLGCLIRGFWLS